MGAAISAPEPATSATHWRQRAAGRSSTVRRPVRSITAGTALSTTWAVARSPSTPPGTISRTGGSASSDSSSRGSSAPTARVSSSRTTSRSSAKTRATWWTPATSPRRTGTGSWRRNPDAKWRLRPGALEIRRKEQVTVLERAVPLVKPGGRIAYITCSVLDDENGAQVRDFIKRHPEYSIQKPASLTAALGERGMLFQRAVLMSEEGLLMTPRRTGTDGFFISLLRRAA